MELKSGCKLGKEHQFNSKILVKKDPSGFNKSQSRYIPTTTTILSWAKNMSQGNLNNCIEFLELQEDTSLSVVEYRIKTLNKISSNWKLSQEKYLQLFIGIVILGFVVLAIILSTTIVLIKVSREINHLGALSYWRTHFDLSRGNSNDYTNLPAPVFKVNRIGNLGTIIEEAV